MTKVKNTKIRTEPATVVFNVIGYVIISIAALLCLLPFWLITSAAFSTEDDIAVHGFSLFPKHFSTMAFQSAFSVPEQIYKAYEVTILLTIGGTAISLFLISMAGYVLSRKDFKYRGSLSFFIYFTTLFSGGLIPWYIMIVKYLQWKDSYMALLLPMLMNAFFIILMKNFIQTIPDDITESAKMDGAGDFTIYYRLILPLAGPGLATVGLFIALDYWNNWFLANLFMNTPSKYPLQLFLYKMLANAAMLKTSLAGHITGTVKPPAETLKMAVSLIVTGPIILLYPFLQKYFVKGLTVGAVKG